MQKHKRECLRICRRAGLTVLGIEQRGKHLGVICKEGCLICRSTPSDRRFRHNLFSVARRRAR